MTSSRLKFELIEGFESNTASAVGAVDRNRTTSGHRLYSDMTTSQEIGSSKYSEEAEWPPKSSSVRSGGVTPGFDIGLLNDLAESLDYLHRQLDDSETELETSREQSRSFEIDAKRWEQEAARLREEGEATRKALDQLRAEFDQSRDSSLLSQAAVAKLAEEVAEMRAARAQLEALTVEQQRALVVSLEMLKRLNSAEPAQAEQLAGPQQDAEILELRRLLECANDDGRRTEEDLFAARQELEVRNMALAAAGAEVESLQEELSRARAELENRANELDAARAEFNAARAELDLMKEESRRAPGEVGGRDTTDSGAIHRTEIENAAIAQQLQQAEAEIAIQTAEVEGRGAIIVALENALEEQNTSLRTLEERFLAYAEQVQSLQLQRLEMPSTSARSIASKFARIFSPPTRGKQADVAKS